VVVRVEIDWLKNTILGELVLDHVPAWNTYYAVIRACTLLNIFTLFPSLLLTLNQVVLFMEEI